MFLRHNAQIRTSAIVSSMRQDIHNDISEIPMECQGHACNNYAQVLNRLSMLDGLSGFSKGVEKTCPGCKGLLEKRLYTNGEIISKTREKLRCFVCSHVEPCRQSSESMFGTFQPEIPSCVLCKVHWEARRNFRYYHMLDNGKSKYASICTKCWENGTKLDNPDISHVPTLSCLTCHETFHSESLIRKHYKEHHIGSKETKQFSCSKCGEIFRGKNKYKKHMRISESCATNTSTTEPMAMHSPKSNICDREPTSDNKAPGEHSVYAPSNGFDTSANVRCQHGSDEAYETCPTAAEVFAMVKPKEQNYHTETFTPPHLFSCSSREGAEYLEEMYGEKRAYRCQDNDNIDLDDPGSSIQELSTDGNEDIERATMSEKCDYDTQELHENGCSQIYHDVRVADKQPAIDMVDSPVHRGESTGACRLDQPIQMTVTHNPQFAMMPRCEQVPDFDFRQYGQPHRYLPPPILYNQPNMTQMYQLYNANHYPPRMQVHNPMIITPHCWLCGFRFPSRSIVLQHISQMHVDQMLRTKYTTMSTTCGDVCDDIRHGGGNFSNEAYDVRQDIGLNESVASQDVLSHNHVGHDAVQPEAPVETSIKNIHQQFDVAASDQLAGTVYDTGIEAQTGLSSENINHLTRQNQNDNSSCINLKDVCKESGEEDVCIDNMSLSSDNNSLMEDVASKKAAIKCMYCVKIFHRRRHFAKHLYEFHLEARCTHCKHIIQGEIAFKKHISDCCPIKCTMCDSVMHINKETQCPHCENAYSRQSYYKHLKSCCPNQCVECSLTVKTFTTTNSTIQNLIGEATWVSRDAIVNRTQFACANCKTVFTAWQSLHSHSKECHYKLSGSHDDITVPKHTGSIEDIKEQHQELDQENRSSTCWLKTSNESEMSAKHGTLAMQSLPPMYVCTDCECVFVSEDNLEQHIYNEHGTLYSITNGSTAGNLQEKMNDSSQIAQNFCQKMHNESDNTSNDVSSNDVNSPDKMYWSSNTAGVEEWLIDPTVSEKKGAKKQYPFVEEDSDTIYTRAEMRDMHHHQNNKYVLNHGRQATADIPHQNHMVCISTESSAPLVSALSSTDTTTGISFLRQEYCCFLCSQDFHQKASLLEHIEEKHSSPFNDKKTSTTFSTSSGGDELKNQALNIKQFIAMPEDELLKLDTNSDVQSSLTTVPLTSNNGLNSTNVTADVVPESSDVPPPMFMCAFCCDYFPSLAVLAGHVQDFHKRPGTVSSMCGFVSPESPKLIYCLQCMQTFESKSDAKYHIFSSHMHSEMIAVHK